MQSRVLTTTKLASENTVNKRSLCYTWHFLQLFKDRLHNLREFDVSFTSSFNWTSTHLFPCGKELNCFFTGLGEKIQSLEDLTGKMTEVDDYTKDLNGTLKKLEDKLQAHRRMGSTAKDPKYQDKIAVSGRFSFSITLTSKETWKCVEGR